VRRLRRGGVRRLYDEHGRVLLGYARAVIGDHGAAEDVLHQVFLKLLRAKRPIPDSPRAYLARAVRNAALNHRRDRSREVSLEDGASDGVARLASWSEPWFERHAALQDETVVLEAALESLPAEQREVVVLHLWGELTFAEVATVMEISPNTAASRYRYALKKLRGRLAPAGETSGVR
jgi:RNA polymerase sigma-70 factor (ECF subfamily)